MSKIDFKKSDKHLYNPPKSPEILEVPQMKFLMIDGKGDPNDADFTEAIENIYPVAYKIKFGLKATKHPGYVVPPMEALWWAEDMGAFIADTREQWQWTIMIRQPEFVDKQIFVDSLQQVIIKKPELNRLNDIRLAQFNEGSVVQMMHIGPYREEGPNIQWMHKYAQEQGYKLHGKHHEIYISDPRKSRPSKMKTVLRQQIIK